MSIVFKKNIAKISFLEYSFTCKYNLTYEEKYE
ncbi:hypothetical protein E4N77_08890 [Treponema denticola]|nr:hypothetical protein E4N78_02950 [Treponema denticola]UTY26763.1 hypothetical protein E4N77_08890 [Treponema denticola]